MQSNKTRKQLIQSLTPEAAARFWSHVSVGGKDECWFWQGYVNPRGYGIVKLAQVTYLAHQVAVALDGRPLQDGQVTRHLCHQPRCCNPWHLRPGTQSENVQDREARRRSQGSSNGNVRLTEEAVRAIRSAPNSRGTIQQLAAHYGVSPTTIIHIVKGVTWKHL